MLITLSRKAKIANKRKLSKIKEKLSESKQKSISKQIKETLKMISEDLALEPVKIKPNNYQTASTIETQMCQTICSQISNDSALFIIKNSKQSMKTQSLNQSLNENKIKWLCKSNDSWSDKLNHKVKSQRQQLSKQITPYVRTILIDWLMQVSFQLKMSKQAFHNAIAYLDKFIKKRQISKGDYQIYAICCLFIAFKLDSSQTINNKLAVELLQNQYSQSEIKHREITILVTLKFKLHPYTLYKQLILILNVAEKILVSKKGTKIIKTQFMHPEHQFYKEAIWMIDGIVMQGKYRKQGFSKTDICLSIIYIVLKKYRYCENKFLRSIQIQNSKYLSLQKQIQQNLQFVHLTKFITQSQTPNISNIAKCINWLDFWSKGYDKVDQQFCYHTRLKEIIFER